MVHLSPPDDQPPHGKEGHYAVEECGVEVSRDEGIEDGVEEVGDDPDVPRLDIRPDEQVHTEEAKGRPGGLHSRVGAKGLDRDQDQPKGRHCRQGADRQLAERYAGDRRVSRLTASATPAPSLPFCP